MSCIKKFVSKVVIGALLLPAVPVCAAQNQQSSWWNYFPIIGGVAVIAVPVTWYYYQKYSSAKKAEKAEAWNKRSEDLRVAEVQKKVDDEMKGVKKLFSSKKIETKLEALNILYNVVVPNLLMLPDLGASQENISSSVREVNQLLGTTAELKDLRRAIGTRMNEMENEIKNKESREQESLKRATGVQQKIRSEMKRVHDLLVAEDLETRLNGLEMLDTVVVPKLFELQNLSGKRGAIAAFLREIGDLLGANDIELQDLKNVIAIRINETENGMEKTKYREQEEKKSRQAQEEKQRRGQQESERELQRRKQHNFALFEQEYATDIRDIRKRWDNRNKDITDELQLYYKMLRINDRIAKLEGQQKAQLLDGYLMWINLSPYFERRDSAGKSYGGEQFRSINDAMDEVNNKIKILNTEHKATLHARKIEKELKEKADRFKKEFATELSAIDRLINSARQDDRKKGYAQMLSINDRVERRTDLQIGYLQWINTNKHFDWVKHNEPFASLEDAMYFVDRQIARKAPLQEFSEAQLYDE